MAKLTHFSSNFYCRKYLRNHNIGSRWRYSYLPLWYTLFYEGEMSGAPPMRPLWFEFPEDTASFKVTP
jgi:hypothetical protein